MKFSLLTLFLLFLFSAKSQNPNLIINPDFELGTPPTAAGQIANATSWDNGCGAAWSFTSGTSNTGYVGTSDLSGLAYQQNQTPLIGAQSGDNFAGFIGADSGYPGGISLPPTYPNPGAPNYKEAIVGNLTAPLTQCEYTLEFWASQPPVQAHLNNVVEVALRTNNCTDPGLVVFSQHLTGTTWQFLSTTFTLTAAQAAAGYTRIEFRRMVTVPGLSGMSDLVYISIDNTSLVQGPSTDFITHVPLCDVDGDVEFYHEFVSPSGATVNCYNTTGGGYVLEPSGVTSITGIGIETYYFVPSALSAGTYEVEVCSTVGGPSCCTTVYFTVCEAPSILFSISQPCNPNATIYTGFAGSVDCPASYYWNGPCGLLVTQTPSLVGCGYGTYTVFIENSACPAAVQSTTLFGPPTLGVPPPATVDLCSWNGVLINPGATTTGGAITYYGSGITGNLFDPSVAGVGAHTITFDSWLNGCIATSSLIINVVENVNWHQTTANSGGDDTQNDVITDSQGNVYIVGTYYETTTLVGGGASDLTINSGMSSSEPNMYVAKYSDCGDLIWLAKTINGAYCLGESIAIDESGQDPMVYVGGDYDGNVKFTSSSVVCGSGYSQSINSGSQQGYLAQFDMNTGCLNFVEIIAINAETSVNSLTINENNGEVFVGGSFQDNPGSNYHYMFVNKYTPSVSAGTFNSMGLPLWQLIDNIITPDHWDIVNDLDYDEVNDRIAIIGDFNKMGPIFNGQSSIVASGSGVSDAFVAIYGNQQFATTLYEHRAGGAGARNWMTGNGISADPSNGHIYFTGTFEGTVSNPYDLSGIGGTAISGLGSSKGYMIGINGPGTSGWNNAWTDYSEATNGQGATKGIDVVANNEEAHFVGAFGNDDITASSLFGAYYGAYSADHVAVMTYASDGTPLWINVSQSTSPTATDVHNGHAIETDRSGYSFVVGDYRGQIDYAVGNPNSGVLVSSGPSNGFALRSDLSNSGAFERVMGGNDDGANSSRSFELLAVPNPTDGRTVVSLSNYDENASYTAQLVGMDGRIHSTKAFSAESVDLDLTGLEDGIYIVSITNGTTTNYVRIVKTN